MYIIYKKSSYLNFLKEIKACYDLEFKDGSFAHKNSNYAFLCNFIDSLQVQNPRYLKRLKDQIKKDCGDSLSLAIHIYDTHPEFEATGVLNSRAELRSIYLADLIKSLETTKCPQ